MGFQKRCVCRSGVLVGLLLATYPGWACGDDGESARTVEVGLLLPFTGPLAQVAAGTEQSARLAILDINEAGGVLDGQTLAFVARDTETNPIVGQARAQELIDDGVTVIMGALSSNVTEAVLDVTVPAEALLMTGSSAAAVLTETDNSGLFFRTSGNSRDLSVMMADRIRASGGHRTALLTLDQAYTNSVAMGFSKAYTQMDCGGAACEVTTNYVYTYGEGQTLETHDFDTGIAQVMATAPDAILFCGFPEDGLGYMRAAISAGYDDLLWTTSAVAAGDVGLVLGNVERTRLRWVDDVPVTSPGAQHFLGHYAEVYGNSIAPQNSAYDVPFVLALAITKAGTTDPLAVAAAVREVANPPGVPVYPSDYARALELLREGTDIEYRGASGSIDFDAFGDVGRENAVYGYDVHGQQIVIP